LEWVGQKGNGSGFYSQTKRVGYHLIGRVRTLSHGAKNFSMSGGSDARADVSLLLNVS